MRGVPRFVVVGHPNKGKSSIVSTLARDDRVRVAPDPGTTRAANTFPMRLDGEVLYELVDTPGFQRARRVLAWLEDHAADASDRPATVRAFLREPGHAERFPDEVALLGAVMHGGGEAASGGGAFPERAAAASDPEPGSGSDPAVGAGVLYVVDGSRPYGPEYEPEMEILRWTGRPGMGLINPIGLEGPQGGYIDAWRSALGQYFSTVRVFDAVEAPFAKRLELLKAFGTLEERWQAPLSAAVAALEADAADRDARAAELVAGLAVAAMRLAVEQRLPSEAASGQVEAVRAELEASYRGELESMERRCRDRVEELYGFMELTREDPASSAAAVGGALFDESTWLRFGLSRGDLVRAGAVAGAAAGGYLDLVAGGSTFFAGAALGGVLGGAAAWFGGEKLARAKLVGQALGGRRVVYGPSRDVNLAFVLLGRGAVHRSVVARRTHARRDAVTASELDAASVRWSKTQRDRVAKALRAVVKRPDDERAAREAIVQLAEVVETVGVTASPGAEDGPGGGDARDR